MLSKGSIPRRDRESKEALIQSTILFSKWFFQRDVYRMVRHHTEWGDLVPLIETVKQRVTIP